MSEFNVSDFFSGFSNLYEHYIEDRLCFRTDADALSTLFDSNLVSKDVTDSKYEKLEAFCRAEAILVEAGCIKNFIDVRKAYEIFEKQVSDNSVLDKLRKDFEKDYLFYENEKAEFEFDNKKSRYTSLPINTSFYGYKMGYNRHIENSNSSDESVEL